MDVQITSRHFKARPSLMEYTTDSLQKLAHIYDGIVSADVVFEVEAHTDGKGAEITLLVYHDRLFAKVTSDEFEKSVAACVDKLETQLRKYKEKLRSVKQKRDERKEMLSGEVAMADEDEE